MRKKYLSRILLGGLIIASTVTLNSCKDYDDDIDGLQEQIDSLSSLHDSEVSTLESSISTLQSTASSLSSEIEDVQEELEAAIAEKADESEVEALQSEVASLTSSLSQVETAISTLQAAHDADIAELETALTEANANIAAAQSTADDALTAATTANETLTTLIASLATVQSNITAQLETLESSVKDALANAAAAQADATAALTYITTLQELEAEDSSKIAELESAQETLESSLTTLEGKVTDAETAITELWAAVNAGVSDADLETIQGLIDTASDALQSQIDDINEGLTTITTDIETIKADILALYGVVANQLKSLVFIPEVYVDGVEGMYYGQFTYYALSCTDQDSETETWAVADDTEATSISEKHYARYYVNPSTALSSITIDQLEIVQPTDGSYDVDYVSSRDASSDLEISIVDIVKDTENGILSVQLDITGEAATDEYISVFALKVNTATSDDEEEDDEEEGEDDSYVVSDFATVYDNTDYDLAIASVTLTEDDIDALYDENIAPIYDATADYHFRDDIDEASDYLAYAAWNSSSSVEAECDLKVYWGNTIDLLDYVAAHKLLDDDKDGTYDCSGTALDDDDYADLSLEWTFEVVGDYLVGSSETDQSEYAEITDGHLLSFKNYTAEASKACIGRTPIIRAKLIHGTDVVKVAYIKVYISGEFEQEEEPETSEVTFDSKEEIVYDCSTTDVTIETTAQWISESIYGNYNIEKTTFHNKYTFEDATVDGDTGTVIESVQDDGDDTSYILQWTITEDDIWTAASNGGGEITNVVTYTYGDNIITITLKASVEEFVNPINIEKADYISNMWDTDYTKTQFNASVPWSTSDEDEDHCLFVTSLNSPFETSSSLGILDVDERVTVINYYFCEDIEDVTTVGDISVTFEVSSDGTVLSATVDGTTEEIATIDNDGTTTSATANATAYANAVTLNKSSDIAKALLNTDELDIYFGATGLVCGDSDKEIAITFNDDDHFVAHYIRPVNIASVAADSFVDGVDYEEDGSIIAIEDLINPYDWRTRYFSNYDNYWEFYGISSITVDVDGAICTLNGHSLDDEYAVAGNDIELTQVDVETIGTEETLGTKTSAYGFLTYQNNGNLVQSGYSIYVTVTVEYTWGTIESDLIEIPVEPYN